MEAQLIKEWGAVGILFVLFVTSARYAIPLLLKEFESTRLAHKENTQAILTAQKEREEADRLDRRERDSAQEKRFAMIVEDNSSNREAFMEGIKAVRDMHEDYKREQRERNAA